MAGWSAASAESAFFSAVHSRRVLVRCYRYCCPASSRCGVHPLRVCLQPVLWISTLGQAFDPGARTATARTHCSARSCNRKPCHLASKSAATPGAFFTMIWHLHMTRIAVHQAKTGAFEVSLCKDTARQNIWSKLLTGRSSRPLLTPRENAASLKLICTAVCYCRRAHISRSNPSNCSSCCC